MCCPIWANHNRVSSVHTDGPNVPYWLHCTIVHRIESFILWIDKMLCIGTYVNKFDCLTEPSTHKQDNRTSIPAMHTPVVHCSIRIRSAAFLYDMILVNYILHTWTVTRGNVFEICRFCDCILKFWTAHLLLFEYFVISNLLMTRLCLRIHVWYTTEADYSCIPLT